MWRRVSSYAVLIAGTSAWRLQLLYMYIAFAIVWCVDVVAGVGFHIIADAIVDEDAVADVATDEDAVADVATDDLGFSSVNLCITDSQLYDVHAVYPPPNNRHCMHYPASSLLMHTD